MTRKEPRSIADEVDSLGSSPDALGNRNSEFRFFIPPLLALLSSLLFAASFPNFFLSDGAFPLGFLALVPLFISLSASEKGGFARDALAGAVFGLFGYALLAPWAFSYHPAAPAALLLAKSLSCAVAAVLAGKILRAYPRWGWIIAALLWTAGEYIGSSGFLAFPYGVLGYSQARNSPLLATASLWGVHGVSFVLASTSAFIASLVRSFVREGRRFLRVEGRRYVVVLLIFILIHAAGALALVIPLGGGSGGVDRGSKSEISILLIQADTAPRRSGPKPPGFYAEILSTAMSARGDGFVGVDLVVTPETVFPYSLEDALEIEGGGAEAEAARRIASVFRDAVLPCLLGTARAGYGVLPSGERGPLVRNSALYLEGGKVWAAYDKRRLVPLVESFPFYRAFPAAYRSLETVNRFFWTAGEAPTLFSVGDARIGTPICYEDCFGPDCLDFARSGANILVSMSSDAWADSESAKRQHLLMAAFRAAETGLPLLRATNDGISCLIDGHGRIAEEMPSSVRETRRYDIDLRGPSRTPYAVIGDAFPRLAGILSLAALGFALVRSLGRKSPEESRPRRDVRARSSLTRRDL